MKIAITIVVLIIIGAVGFIVFGNAEHSAGTSQQGISSEDKSKGDGIASIAGYEGSLLAGSTSPYLAFKKADYEKATREGKTIFLDFYATWCPVCRAEAPGIKKGFDSLSNENVVGFRVNFNDGDTDESEEELAKSFNVPNQYTKIVIKNGEEIIRTEAENWNEDTVLEELSDI